MAVSVVVLALPVLAAPGASSPQPMPPQVHISAQTRMIVISPHPDDAVLGAGGLIQRAIGRHASVEVVEMTSGDAFPKGVVALRRVPRMETYRWYGTLREREALQAMRQLGVTRSRIRLLGFPDEGLCSLADNQSPEAVFFSPYTHRDSPPVTEQVVAGAKYRGTDAQVELEQVFRAFRPSLVVLPDGHDEHPDHCATHILVHEAVERAVMAGVRPPMFLHYLIHYRNWPIDPAQVPHGPLTELRLTSAERVGKVRAVSAYKSQMVVMSPFMDAFARADERFASRDEQPAAACWCRGENIVVEPGLVR